MPCLLLDVFPEMHAAAKEAGFDYKLHSFPHDSISRKQWYCTIKPFEIKYPQYGVGSDELCSLHFKPSDFEASTLKHNAVPSVFTAVRRTELWELNRRLTHVARCCVPGCHTTVSYNLHPFVPEFDARDGGLARKRFRLWVRTLQVAPCEGRPEVWICRRHFVNGFPADLRNFHSVDWIPTLHLEDIPGNRCRECTVVVEKLQVEVPVRVAEEERDPNLEVPFCRLCLVQNVPLQSMFLNSSAGQQLAELIERFTAIKINSRRDCNGAVCFKCLENLAQMEKMEQIKARWNSKNDLLERLRANNNNLKEDPGVQEVEPPPVVSIPIDTLITSIIDPPPKEEDLDYEDFKQDLNPANISQDCVIVDPPAAEIIDLTDIDERERLINQAIANLRKQLKPRKRKRSKTNQTTTQDEPSPLKPCRNTRIG